MNLAAHVLPPELPQRRRWWPWVLGAVAVVAVLLTALIYRPFPTEEERKYFGWWYGAEFNNTEYPRAWIAEFRDDGTLRITFGQYLRAGPDKDWTLTTSEEMGSWRIREGVQCLASEDPARPSGWWQRIERMQNTGDWRRVHYYRTTAINDREMRYESVTEGHEFHALHAHSPVKLPREPLLPENWSVTPPAR